MVQVVKSDVKRFYNTLADDQHLKISTIDGIHNVLHQVFQVAVDDNYIRGNPTDRMLKELKVAHGHEVEKRKALTLDQQELFLRYIKETEKYQHWYPIFFIMLNTGMRVGEITGLRWRDVDFEQGFINVNHTLVYYNHRDELGAYFSINTPKTDAGKRDIPMIEGVREAFEMERQYQVKNGIESKARIDGYDDFIFVNRNGLVQHQGTLNKALKRILRDCNDDVLLEHDLETDPTLLPNFSCHILRHTFATRLCESGSI
ncbi:MAG: tyrosine-type recombinase/integrase [Oscillospiraceae bacterium]